ncbi:hypothetical protein SAMN05444266_102208 [Chitinophaga jiangningensis]|uniref:DUF5672 domain-containing protein n=1 Tax=Chitinophaga jiangningensis TaxID=1419482 RepID=A0A1M6Y900_9BACT|nr:hypothetical protein [Chitinophaga jiangningensis]SHL14721.1 hypothetical protein SAMN05444266_102208 [Chitinophaga jiangningensis]
MQYKLLLTQADTTMFNWQLKVFFSSIEHLEIPKQNIILLTEIKGKPSEDFRKFERLATCHYFEDKKQRFYKPSCKPHLYGRFWEMYPACEQEYFFFAEQDMLISALPEVPLKPDTWFWSDASKFIETGKFEHVIGMQPRTSKPGGFHAIGTGVNADFWYKVEEDSIRLFEYMCKHIDVQYDRWICEMRAWIWNIWDRGFKTELSPELDFEYGKGWRRNVKLYHHLDARVFDKTKFRHTEPFEVMQRYHVPEELSVSRYINAVKDCGKNFLKKFNDA